MKKNTIKTLLVILGLAAVLPNAIGQSWSSLNGGLTNSNGTAVVNCIVADSSTGGIFVAGQFTGAGSLTANNIAEWNGTTWSNVGGGISSAVGVSAMCMYKGILYAAESGTATIYEWNGSTWSIMPKHANSTILSMVACYGKLYVGGNFDSIGGIRAPFIASWDGSKWDSLQGPLNKYVYALATYKNNLYAAGQFDNAGKESLKAVAEWTGTKWDSLPQTGVVGVIGSAYALGVYNGKLIVGGYFSAAGNTAVNNIASWDGTTWADIGNGVTSYATVYALASYNGLLYVGGDFVQAGSLFVNDIASWNGTTWDTLGAGADGTIYALTAYNGLYVGGNYTQIGMTSPEHQFTTTVMTNAIAEWQAPVGINEVLENKSGNVYPNPNSGNFNIELDNINATSELKLYNVYGQEVYSAELNSGTNNIKLGSAASGLYLYRILNTNGNIMSTGKISIEK